MILTTFCVEVRLRWDKRKQEKNRLEDYYSGSEENDYLRPRL